MSPLFLRPEFAFGGSLPAEGRAGAPVAAERTGVETPLLDAVLEANAPQIRRAEERARASRDGPVGIVGISFKAGTDDLRRARWQASRPG